MLSQANLGDAAIKLAILDGAIDLEHPCFKNARIEQPWPRGAATAHGTHIASIIWGQPGSEIAGIAPRTTGLSVPVFGSDQSSGLRSSQLELARAVLQALSWGAHIINISAGEPVSSGNADPALAAALQRCEENNVLVVAAAGNEGCACLHAPACVPTVLAVGAMDERGQPLPFSNWGELYRKNGLLAPGIDIRGAILNGGSEERTGTSCATAIVSATCAQLLADQHQRGRALDPLAIRRVLLETARRCDEHPASECKRSLAGRINVAAAISRLKQMENIVQDNESTLDTVSDFDQAPISAAPLASAEGAAPQGKVAPSSCCSSCAAATSGGLVYALGTVDYDFGTDARRNSFVQRGLEQPTDVAAFAAFLERFPAHAEAVHWLLMSEATPIYAITPRGTYSEDVYKLLRGFLLQQRNEGVEQVSIPGRIDGSVTLSNGQKVPAIVPDVRGMFSWSSGALVDAVMSSYASADAAPNAEAMSSEIGNFLDRVYYELRNLGVSSQERAINFAATNAFQLTQVYASCVQSGMRLDAIETARSPIGPQGADCWDVKLTFFHPTKQHEVAPVMYRLTVDVSDVIPVTLGKVRSWHVR